MVEEDHRGAGVRPQLAVGERRPADVDGLGRVVVGAVNEATGWYLAGDGRDPESLIDGLCRILAP